MSCWYYKLPSPTVPQRPTETLPPCRQLVPIGPAATAINCSTYQDRRQYAPRTAARPEAASPWVGTHTNTNGTANADTPTPAPTPTPTPTPQRCQRSIAVAACCSPPPLATPPPIPSPSLHLSPAAGTWPFYETLAANGCRFYLTRPC